jgi:hypothetical protein
LLTIVKRIHDQWKIFGIELICTATPVNPPQVYFFVNHHLFSYTQVKKQKKRMSSQIRFLVCALVAHTRAALLTVDCSLSTNFQSTYNVDCEENKYGIPGEGDYTVYTFQAIRDSRNDVGTDLYVDVPAEYQSQLPYLHRVLWAPNTCSPSCKAFETLTEDVFPFWPDPSNACYSSSLSDMAFTIQDTPTHTTNHTSPGFSYEHAGINQAIGLGQPQHAFNGYPFQTEHLCITLQILIHSTVSPLELTEIYYGHLQQESFLAIVQNQVSLAD